MSRKHFVAFANYIAELNRIGQHIEAKACYEMIVRVQDNPNFNRSRFENACQFPETSSR